MIAFLRYFMYITLAPHRLPGVNSLQCGWRLSVTEFGELAVQTARSGTPVWHSATVKLSSHHRSAVATNTWPQLQVMYGTHHNAFARKYQQTTHEEVVYRSHRPAPRDKRAADRCQGTQRQDPMAWDKCIANGQRQTPWDMSGDGRLMPAASAMGNER
jgi:tellurite resistance-related uncharacterized protein